MKQSVAELMTKVSEIKDKQTDRVVELAIAFGMSRMMGEGEQAVSLTYSTSEIVGFLKQYRVSTTALEEGTIVTLQRIGEGADAT